MMSLLTLERIKAFLSQFAECSGSVYWLSNPSFTEVVYVNSAYEIIWGRPRQILYDDPYAWIDYLHPRDRALNPLGRIKAQLAQEGASAYFVNNYRIVRPNGDIRWIIDRSFPVCNEINEIIAVTGVAIDTTDLTLNRTRWTQVNIATLDALNQADPTFNQIYDKRHTKKRIMHLQTSNQPVAKVLLVEDDPLSAQMLGAMLIKLGCCVDIAVDTQSVMKELNREHYDLILMDIELPDENGIIITKKIRASSAHYKNVPIVASTAYSSPVIEADCLNAGMQAVISKPMTRDVIQRVLIPYISVGKIAKPIVRATHSPISSSLIRGQDKDSREETEDEMHVLLRKALPNEWADIEAAYQQNDDARLGNLLHRCRGGLTYCNVPKLFKAIRLFEDALKVGVNRRILELAYTDAKKAVVEFLKKKSKEDALV